MIFQITPTSRGVPGLAVASQSVQESTAVQLLRDGRELRPWSLVPVVKTPIRFHVHTVNLLARMRTLPPIARIEQPTPQQDHCDYKGYRNHSVHSVCSAALITAPSIPSRVFPKLSVSTSSSATSSSTCTNGAVTASRYLRPHRRVQRSPVSCPNFVTSRNPYRCMLSSVSVCEPLRTSASASRSVVLICFVISCQFLCINGSIAIHVKLYGLTRTGVPSCPLRQQGFGGGGF